MSTDKNISYQPKGSMCASCINKDNDCSVLRFKDMPIIQRTGTGRVINIVKCTNHSTN